MNCSHNVVIHHYVSWVLCSESRTARSFVSFVQILSQLSAGEAIYQRREPRNQHVSIVRIPFVLWFHRASAIDVRPLSFLTVLKFSYYIKRIHETTEIETCNYGRVNGNPLVQRTYIHYVHIYIRYVCMYVYAIPAWAATACSRGIYHKRGIA